MRTSGYLLTRCYLFAGIDPKGVVAVSFSGLAPNTQYYFFVEDQDSDLIEGKIRIGEGEGYIP